MEEKFRNFLNEYVKQQNYNFSAYIDDLTSQWCNSGLLEYELHSSESKDGKNHIFSYSLEELQELGYGLY